MNNYHKIDSKILQFDLESIEFKFGMWITKKEFGQRLNDTKPLPKGQFYMSVRVVAKDIEVTEKIARRLIRQFTKLDIIRLVAISKSPKQGSIYEYLVQVEKGTVEDTVKTQLGHSKNEKISDFEEGKGHSKGTIEGTVKGTSKNNNKLKENNIYSVIFNFWISKDIKKHRSLSPGIKKSIDKALKEFSKDEILEAINNYSEVLKSDYYFSYVWGLDEFLVRTDKDRIRQLPKFLNDGSTYMDYISWRDKNKPLSIDTDEIDMELLMEAKKRRDEERRKING